LLTVSLVKITVSVAIVIGLAEVSKRINPMWGGILMGLPLGAGLSVYFIGQEQGVLFVLEGIPWAIGGLASTLLFCLAYLGTGLYIRTQRVVGILICSAAATAAFLLSGKVLHSLSLTLATALLIFAVVWVVNIKLLNRIPAELCDKKTAPLKGHELLLRGLVTAVIILLVTTAAPWVGARWSGIFSSFPSTLYALLVIIHYDGGNQLYPSVIRGFGYSVSTLVVFYLGCLWGMPVYGFIAGFIFSYGISAFYLFLMHKLLQS
jgi:hypothetical protein